jgi:hypothetical protein
MTGRDGSIVLVQLAVYSNSSRRRRERNITRPEIEWSSTWARDKKKKKNYAIRRTVENKM